MKELSLDECKIILLDVLKSIDKCCRDNNIQYSLGWGTLLGAVRHKGFIPWDDDIDLFMTRDNFNKFINTFNDDNYEMLTRKDDDWSWYYIRICDKKTVLKFHELYEKIRPHGLWIAIFPMDNIPDDPNEWNKMKRAITFWGGLRKLKHSMWVPTGIIRNIAKALCRFILLPFSSDWFSKKEEEARVSYFGKEPKRCWAGGEKIYLTDKINSYIEIEFEGNKFMAIKDYDYFLKINYGDYMQLPPIEEQVPRHDYIAYLK